MSEPLPPADAPGFVISSIAGPLQIMDACLRLYVHPQLLSIAEQINGLNLTPFAESIIVKPAGLGISVAWHQDGTKQWDKPDWNRGTHGFDFMAQLYRSTGQRGLGVTRIAQTGHSRHQGNDRGQQGLRRSTDGE